MRSTIGSSSASAAALLALVVATAPAAAQALSEVERAQAEALFQEGKKLLAQGKVSEACEKLAASYRLDRAGGTILNLALCHEQEGRTASAWAEFKEALALAKAARRRDREKIASDHIAVLEKKLSHLVIKVAPGADVEGLEVTLDENAIRKEGWGIPIPADPGARKVAAVAPGRKAWEKQVEVGEAKDVEVVVPVLEKLPEPPPEKPKGAGGGPAPVEEGGPTWMRPAGFVALGLGVVGLGVGGYFGMRAVSLGDEAKVGCPGNQCNEAGWEAFNDGRSAATAANVLIGVGAGLAVVGTVMVLLGGSSEPAAGAGPAPAEKGLRIAPTLRAGASGAAVGLEGVW